MTNTADTPNRLEMCRDSQFKAHFGDVYSIKLTRPVNGDGHARDHFMMHFRHGLCMEVTAQTLRGIVRRGQEALVAMPNWAGDCSGALTEIDGQP